MKVLSLFDGMACGYLAMQAAGIEVESYDAFEIDETAIKTAKHNFPDIREHGDVFKADFTKFKGVDILCGGSPCTYWSIAAAGQGQRETTASGLGWDLFSQYVRALRQAQPRYFVYENNASMSKQIRAEITKTFGFEPIEIDSALVSAQSRKRLYWVGIRDGGKYRRVNISQPKERGVIVQDILDSGISATKKGYAVTHLEGNGRDWFKKHHTNIAFRIVKIGVYPMQDGEESKSKPYRIYSTDNKGVTICGCGGGLGAKTGLYAIKGKTFEVKDGYIFIGGRYYPIKLPDGHYEIRPLTVTETKRMQTVPDWYEFPCSKTQAYKMLGNGWTVEVIAHLLSEMLAGKESEQLTFEEVLKWKK